jgi:hypothetical protein
MLGRLLEEIENNRGWRKLQNKEFHDLFYLLNIGSSNGLRGASTAWLFTSTINSRSSAIK